MALIGKIRERSGLVLGLITLAVLGFLIMDITQGGPSGGKSSIFDNPNTMGEVAGSKISTQDFNRAKDILYNGSKADYLSISSQLWNFFVEKAIVEKEAEALGLGVGKDELMNLQFNTDPNRLSPIVQQRYAENPGILQQVKGAIENNQFTGEQRAYWAEQEQEIIKDRLQSKLNAMVSKGAYAPKWMTTMAYQDQNNKADFTYVKVPFVFAKDEEVQVTDADYKAYIEDNKGIFLRKRPARKLAYGIFNVAATQSDSQAVAKKVASLVADFKAAKSDSIFVLTNDGAYETAYLKKDQLSKQAADSLFTKGVGAIVGPYLDGNAYRVAKILGRRVIADSVKARHILFKQQTMQTVDSLFAALKAGKTSWDSLNVKYSEDKVSAAKGGDLGYFAPNMMVKEFNDLCFYQAEQGKFYKIVTQFGAHIVQVTGVKNIKNEQGVKVAYIKAGIEPSAETQAKVREKAISIVQQYKTVDAMKEALAKEGITMETSQLLEENDYQISNLGVNAKSRQMVRWANEAKLGQVASEVFEFSNEGQYYTSKYVVAGLKSILPVGLPSVADIKDEYMEAVKNRKKGELLKGKLAGKDLNGVLAFCNNPNTKIDTARQANFAAQFVPGLGNEPKVIASVFASAQGATTEPIIGTNGVYVAQVQARMDSPAPADVTAAQKQMTNTQRSQIRARLMPAMKDNVTIKDYRAKQGF